MESMLRHFSITTKRASLKSSYKWLTQQAAWPHRPNAKTRTSRSVPEAVTSDVSRSGYEVRA
jgi:hypothetical protein